jgi:hypothetical protein
MQITYYNAGTPLLRELIVLAIGASSMSQNTAVNDFAGHEGK